MELVRFFEDAFAFSEARSGGHILTYFIPGAGADTTVGRRRLNWVWYAAADQDELGPLLIDRDGRQHHASLRLSFWPIPGERAGAAAPLFRTEVTMVALEILDARCERVA
jgi:hypothetical protein